jgi:molybdopterin synthase sulfur carrier subunit
MKIELELYASLTPYMPKKTDENPHLVEINESITIGEFLENLKIPTGAVRIIFLNGVHARGDEILKEGDRLAVFPPLAGG